MGEKEKIGIIFCKRYSQCGGGKCLRAMRNREGAFSIYQNQKIELVSNTTFYGDLCENKESLPIKMAKNKIQVIHLATGVVVDYPYFPKIKSFRSCIEQQFGVEVVIGTHPITQKIYLTHKKLNTWNSPDWQEVIQPILATKETRLAYS